MKDGNFAASMLALLGIVAVLPAALAAPTAPHWVKMPLLSPEAKAAGVFPGGEGSQVLRGPVAVSAADPNFLLMPIDVGGVYRSLDGGGHWTISMSGWEARGANGFAIDPKNAKHALGIAGNSMDWDKNWGPSPHGLYLSSDQAASWKHVLALTSGTNGKAAWDESSYDPARRVCTVAYFISPVDGLLRSADGGTTWTRPGTGADPDGFRSGLDEYHVAVDRKGIVYVGSKGLFRSADGGKMFRRVYASAVWGLSLTPDGSITVSGPDKIAASHDSGQSWNTPACTGLDTQNGKPVSDVAVCPLDPTRMLCWVQGDNWNWKRFLSKDSGATWQPVTLDSSNAPLPPNARPGYITWSPTDPKVAYSLGGDWVTKSTDGGSSFHWSNNGNNGIMLGGLFNFSTHAPGVVFLGFQDYNGAFTTDGGATWNYRDVSGKGWGGYDYGGYALSRDVMWVGDADGWSAPRHLRLSRDGGKTWAGVNGPDGQPLVWHGPDVSSSDPSQPAVCFASNLRSADSGKTWAAMTGCSGVYTADAAARALYGVEGNAIVHSSDHGATWEKVVDVPGGFSDLAVDPKAGLIYAASQDRLKVWNGTLWSTIDTPRDQRGSPRVVTVALDPANPRVIYVGGPRNVYTSAATVCRTTDGGQTWQNLTPITARADGPHEVSAIRVDPVTHWAWVNGQCFGLWRIAPPLLGERGVSASLASAPAALTPPYPPAPPVVAAAIQIQNGSMEAGGATPEGWSLSWTGSGKLIASRDTSEHHSGAASLKLASDGGAAKGQAAQFIDAAPGTSFTVSGWVKTTGAAAVNFAVQPVNAAWGPIAFFQVGYAQNATGWTRFEKKVTLPADTKHVALVLLLDGTGTAWLDDVVLELSLKP